MRYWHGAGPAILLYVAIMTLFRLDGTLEGYLMMAGLGLSIYSAIHWFKNRKAKPQKQTAV